MNHYFLPDDEQQELNALEDALDNNQVKSVENASKEKLKLKQYAKNTLNKTRNINIRISERDLHKLKAKAAEEGIPYQTLAASILHKNSSK